MVILHLKHQFITPEQPKPGQSYSKMYRKNPEPRYNEIPDITNTIQKPSLKICPDITNKWHLTTEVECTT